MGRPNLWKEVDQLLRGRPGWKLQATTVPGAPPLWCFSEGGEVELTVSAESDAIQVYEMENDRATTLRQPDELAAWLRAYRAESFADRPTAEPRDRRRRGFLQW